MGALPAARTGPGQPFAARQARRGACWPPPATGPDHPLRFELKHFSVLGTVTPAVQSDWREVGVEVRLAVADIPVFFSELQAGAFQAGLHRLDSPTTPIPTNFLNLMRSDDPGANYGGWKDPRLRRPGAAPRRPMRRTDLRASCLQQAETRMLQAAPIAPVYVNPSLEPREPARHRLGRQRRRRPPQALGVREGPLALLAVAAVAVALLHVVLALVRRSAASDLPTSVTSLNWPLSSRRT
jgi:ABC-type transport system substrate-binding protein